MNNLTKIIFFLNHLAFNVDAICVAVLNRLISSLEEEGTRCCHSGAFWASCVTPIIERLQRWKIFGIPDNPAWDTD
jgi:hypothetical protein